MKVDGGGRLGLLTPEISAPRGGDLSPSDGVSVSCFVLPVNDSSTSLLLFLTFGTSHQLWPGLLISLQIIRGLINLGRLGHAVSHGPSFSVAQFCPGTDRMIVLISQAVSSQEAGGLRCNFQQKTFRSFS